MTKVMVGNWNGIEVLTGVARPSGCGVAGLVGGGVVGYERGFSFYEYFLFNESVTSSFLQPRLKLRYLQISCLMHYTKSSISKVLTMRRQDLDNLISSLKKKKIKGKIESENAVNEIERLFKSWGAKNGFSLLFHAPHKELVPLSKARVMETFLKLSEPLTETVGAESYDVA